MYVPDPVGVGSWEQGPLESWPSPQWGSVDTGRYYPTGTTDATGAVLFLAGAPDDARACPTADYGNPNIPVILKPSADPPIQWPWQFLHAAEYFPPGPPPCPNPNQSPFQFNLGLYPFAFQLADGTFFYAGYSDFAPWRDFQITVTRKLDPVLQTWTTYPATLPPGFQVCQSAVLYQTAQVLGENVQIRTFVTKAGGGQFSGGASAQTFTIEVSSPFAQWLADGSMPQARKDFYVVALPDGKILAVGGQNAQGPVYQPALYDPYATPRWRALNASMTTARTYHSAAVLVRDGSVLITGGIGPSTASYQIYRPPYFFQGPRPVISHFTPANPPIMYYNSPHTVTTPDADEITHVRLIRLGAATHSFDQNQRLLELEFTHAPGTDELQLKGPLNGFVAPPGYYMLFIASGAHGVLPSEGMMIQVRAS